MATFLTTAKSMQPALTAMYRALHQHPETGFQEKWTTAYIAEKLQKLGIEVTTWDDLTGVLGVLKGGKPGPCVALRSDIDALPMQEDSGLPYSSCIPGIMHACGHDAHITALLGAAELLSKQRDSLKGTVKFIFQPAEELLGGAKAMLAKGVLENPKPGLIVGLHTAPNYPTGTLALPVGPFQASGAVVTLTLTGVGGHGAVPHLAKDPVLAAGGILTALQSIVSRQVPPTQAAVITFGCIHGGTVGNIIPEKVELKGIVRAFDKKVFSALEGQMRKVIAGAAAAYQVKADFTFTPVVPTLSNTDKMANWVRTPLCELVGEKNIRPFEPMLGSEDFAVFSAKVPSVYCFFGIGNKEKQTGAPLHNPAYRVDEDALPLAAATYAQIAQAWLSR